jgi:hypothetical protein
MLGELSLFLGLHISQSIKGIFISHTKYIKEMLKKIRMEYGALVSTPMIKGCKLKKMMNLQKQIKHCTSQ